MKNSIPIDLIIEIVSRSTAKSVARCHCVSKQWRAIFRRKYFIELFLRRSKARPRILFVVQDGEWSEWSFLSLPQPQYSSLVVESADFHMKNFSAGISGYNYFTYASGLIYFESMRFPKEDEDEKPVLCDPLTGKYVILPEPRVFGMYSYLGFDPVHKEFKVLFMTTPDYIASKDLDHYILTLGTGEFKWRTIQCPFTHEPLWTRICINGVLYYSAMNSDGNYVIVCFDVRSEKFKLVDTKCRSEFNGLINYKGKLCGIMLKYAYHGGFPIKLRMRVLDDVEKEEWSTYVYTLCDDDDDESEVVKVKVTHNLSVVGMIATGDIVLFMKFASNPFYVFYFNPERNSLQVQSVEIQGLGANPDRIACNAFVDYVEDLSVNDAMLQLNSIPLQQD
ncbi:unnamed protein product [Arabidopsis thaliana]|uniref:F-box domain-containing protein n=1 Tax=Arabidopsis thaliana TaxID=3702 RepID=A0A5S9WIV5_ARATH|nr:unnamed protein product [Arabidopsis thaliana]